MQASIHLASKGAQRETGLDRMTIFFNWQGNHLAYSGRRRSRTAHAKVAQGICNRLRIGKQPTSVPDDTLGWLLHLKPMPNIQLDRVLDCAIHRSDVERVTPDLTGPLPFLST